MTQKNSNGPEGQRRTQIQQQDEKTAKATRPRGVGRPERREEERATKRVVSNLRERVCHKFAIHKISISTQSRPNFSHTVQH